MTRRNASKRASCTHRGRHRPATSQQPPPTWEMVRTENEAAIWGLFTLPFSITGETARSLALRWTADALPVGVQLVADYRREDLLLRLAAHLEQALPWTDSRPAKSRAGE